jgi:hypothetical protein
LLSKPVSNILRQLVETPILDDVGLLVVLFPFILEAAHEGYKPREQGGIVRIQRRIGSVVVGHVDDDDTRVMIVRYGVAFLRAPQIGVMLSGKMGGYSPSHVDISAAFHR